MKVTKAVIPAAGIGARMRPITNAVPKELLPVGPLPMMQYAVAEAVAAGMAEIFVVIHREKKRLIEEFYSKSNWRELTIYHSESENKQVSLNWVHQENPLGVMDALDQVRGFIGNEPFAVLMPDNVFFGTEPCVSALLDCFKEYEQNLLGLIEVTEESARLFGNNGRVAGEFVSDDVFVISKLQDKGPGTFELAGLGKALRACGRCVFRSEFFREADMIDKKMLRENDEVPVLQKLVANGKMLGVLLKERLFDCGHWEGYWAANQYWINKRR